MEELDPFVVFDTEFVGSDPGTTSACPGMSLPSMMIDFAWMSLTKRSGLTGWAGIAFAGIAFAGNGPSCGAGIAFAGNGPSCGAIPGKGGAALGGNAP
jgi:hypothetical protein